MAKFENPIIEETYVFIRKARAQLLDLVEIAVGSESASFVTIRKRILGVFGSDGIEGHLNELENDLKKAKRAVIKK